ncbi:NXPE family member 3-like isoform X2 [Haliotis asinina]|uniref:NXPE family member 3-like isoform X2 n=1 Tax=Haliotis asinina TaxID=109174 RepID=UPI003531F511
MVVQVNFVSDTGNKICGLLLRKQIIPKLTMGTQQRTFLLFVGVVIVTLAYYLWPHSMLNELTSLHASGSLSHISLVGIKKTYELNETVIVNIVLFDHWKRPKTCGGDMLVVWMKDPQHGAASAGSVIDNGNGTYTGVLRTLWTGSAIIRAAMISSRERIDHMYISFQNGYFGKEIECIFRSNTSTEITSGHMEAKYMKIRPFCNLTADYFGIPFYCGRPKTKGIGCKDWKETSLPHSYMTFDADTRWFSAWRSTEYLSDYATIHISSTRNEKDPAVSPKIPCGRRNFRDTWLATPPVGFSYNNTWRPLSCRNSVPVDAYNQCLANKTVKLLGDSTVRQIFGALYSMLGFTITKGPPEGKRTKKRNFYEGPTICEANHPKYNYTVYLLPHGFPLWFAKANRTITKPVFARLDDIPSGSNDIILINLYAHFHFTPIHIYRARVHRTRIAIENLLKRSPDVTIIIKGPHKFSVRKSVSPLGGMWGPAYENILKKEFVNLYDQVMYLDVWDMTVAFENEDTHPHDLLVTMMVKVFLGYICWK